MGSIVTWLLVSGAAPAADWPQYRGPNHDGISVEPMLKQWPAGGPRVLWKKPLPDGFGSFAVSQGKAYTSVKRLIGGSPQEVFVALNADTGEELWATPVGPAARDGITGEGDGPRSTPAVDGDRVYVLSAYVSLHCLNANDGSVVWQRNLRAEFGGRGPDFEAAASPLIEGDMVLVNGPVGGAGEKLFGIYKRDGRTAWEGPSAKLTHSTPVAVTLLGVRQVLFFTAGGMVSVLPETGKELWRHSFAAGPITAISPVIGGDIVYHSSAYGTGARAVQIAKSGDTFRATELWYKRGELQNYWSTPVYHNGYLYGVFGQDTGITAPLKCVELATGAEKWSRPGFGGGQVLLGDGKLLVLSADGKLISVEASPAAYTELARFQALTFKCWNVPAISSGRIYARSNQEGVCLDVSVNPPASLRLISPRSEPDGGFLFTLTSSDGSTIAPERLGRIEVLTSPTLAASLANWTKLTNSVVSGSAMVQLPPPPGNAPQRFFIVSERE